MKLINEDCLEVMKEMPDGCIDLTVTSPPYDNLRTYKDSLEWGEHIWKPVLEQLYRVAKAGGVVVWVVGDSTIKGSESGVSFRQALYAKECGFNLHDTMIYQKAQACFGSNNCYLQAFEYMFIFSKGKPNALNFIRDRANKRAGVESMGASGLSADGSKAKRIKKEMKAQGKRKNIWEYGVGGGKTGHPAVFPEKLANDHIISWSNEGDTVFDPFMGSGTTGVACKNLNRSFIGIEKVEEYFKIAEERINSLAL